MSYHQDWLMRQIESITAMLKFIAMGQKTAAASVEKQEDTVSGGNDFAVHLLALAARGKICEAENLLFEALEAPGPETLDAAVQFYGEINKLSDEALEQQRFSREEIKTSLEAVCKAYCIFP